MPRRRRDLQDPTGAAHHLGVRLSGRERALLDALVEADRKEVDGRGEVSAATVVRRLIERECSFRKIAARKSGDRWYTVRAHS